jgi:hypothetical protein
LAWRNDKTLAASKALALGVINICLSMVFDTQTFSDPDAFKSAVFKSQYVISPQYLWPTKHIAEVPHIF